jgi:hypothetical protein
MIVSDEEGLAGMDWSEEEGATLLASKKEYDCVICNQTTPSTEDKPMGLVVLVQVSIAQYTYYHRFHHFIMPFLVFWYSK